VRAASAARTVERGKNPEDGTGEGLAAFTFPAAVPRPSRVDRSWSGRRGGTRRRSATREQEPQERRFPGSTGTARPRQRSRRFPERGQPRRSPALKGKRTPREDLPGLRLWECGRTRKTPRPVRTARGERWKPRRRYSGDKRTSEGDVNLTRARPSAGDRARPLWIDRESLEGQTKRTATRRHPRG